MDYPTNDVHDLAREVETYLVRVRNAKTLAKAGYDTLENGIQRLQRLQEEIAEFDPDLSEPLESLRQRFANLRRRLDPLLPSGSVQHVQVIAKPPVPLPNPEATIRKAEHGWWLECAGKRTSYQDLGSLAEAAGMLPIITDDLDLWRVSLLGHTFATTAANPFSGSRVSLTLSDER